jgi:hypothetical protein
MNTKNQLNGALLGGGEKGAMTIFFAFAGLTLLGMTALAVESGYMMVTRAELQNVADVATASANRELGIIYEEAGNVDISDYLLTDFEKARIMLAANRFSLKNEAAGKRIFVHPSDFKFGRWDSSSKGVDEGDYGVTAVSVAARRDATANGSVQTLLAGVTGMNSFQAKADAAAQIAPVKKLPAGMAEFPVGIASHWFESKDSPCGPDSFIKFYPTGTLESCAGWHTFQDEPANAYQLKSILSGLRAGTWKSPEIAVGETSFIFTGGTVASALQEAERLFNEKKDANGEWLVHIPVYEASDCANPAGWIKIVGVATAIVTNVTPTGTKKIDAEVQCDVVMFGKGGGPDYGTHVGLGTRVK